MTLKDIFDKYTGRVSAIHIYQAAIDQSFKGELENLHQLARYAEKSEDREREITGFQKVYFWRAADGLIHYISGHSRSPQERIQVAHVYKNKQYLWLLAEAYEAFEDFIEELYGWLGHNDKNFWPLNDFGNIKLNDLGSLTIDWFLKTVHDKKGKPASIINPIRNFYPNIIHLEQNNKLGINLRFVFHLIEKMRHHIVHTGGVVNDKKTFKTKVFTDAGIAANSELEDFIDARFGKGKYENMITLLEVPSDPPFSSIGGQDVFMLFSALLLAYADVIYTELHSQP